MRIALGVFWSSLAVLMQAFGELASALLSLSKSANLMASDYEVELIAERKEKQAASDAKLLALTAPVAKAKS